MIRKLTEGEVREVLELDALVPVVEDALVRQYRGEVERPPRPHTPIGAGLDSGEPRGMALTMPAYVHGADYFATKLVGVFEGNEARGLPTINAQIAVTDARTGLPAAYLGGTTVTNARTGCIGAVAAKHLSRRPVTLGVLGAGAQARWQTRAIAAVTDVEAVRIYSPSDSKYDCAEELGSELAADVRAVETPTDAVEGANVVVTATTSTEPVFPADALTPGALVVAVGAFTEEMQELEPAVFDRAARVFADVPEEVAEIGDLRASDLGESDLLSLAEACLGTAGRESEAEIIVVDSVGSAVFDAAASVHVLERAEEREIGSQFTLDESVPEDV